MARKGEAVFLAATRDATVVTIADAGHACNLDQPEAFDRAVREFSKSLAEARLFTGHSRARP